jgi:integrase/recombinase XerD
MIANSLMSGRGREVGRLATSSNSSPSISATATRAPPLKFFTGAKGRGLPAWLRSSPLHVAAYVELLGRKMSPPSVKQHLAGIRTLFGWKVTAQAMPSNPAHSVRGPRHSVNKGVTPVLSSEEATVLLAGVDISTVVGLRDRALIAVMTYTFARVGAVVSLKVEDYSSQKKRWSLRLSEKNARSTKCLVTTNWKPISTLISRLPASRAIARGRSSALRSAARVLGVLPVVPINRYL